MHSPIHRPALAAVTGAPAPISPRDFGDITEAGAAVLDWNLEIVGVDLGFARLLGRERRALIGRNCAQLLAAPRSGQALFDEMRATPGSTRCADLDFIRLDGSLLYAHAQLQSVGGSALGRPCLVLTLQDRSRRERLGAELNARLSQLEHTQRRLDSAAQQLQHAERLAAVGEVATGVAAALASPAQALDEHLRTLDRYLSALFGALNACDAAEAMLAPEHPARALIANARFAARLDFVAADARSVVADGRRSVGRLRRLVDALGSMAPVSVESWDWYDLRAGLEATVAVVAQQYGDALELGVDYGELPRIFAVTAEINQVLLHLLSNAAQALDGGAGRVTVRAWRDGEQVRLAVRDTGRGIEPAARARLFEPLFTTRANGSGLGLSLVKDIVTRHGGTIEVRNDAGPGAEFVVTLPVDLRAAAEQTERRAAVHAAELAA